MDVQYISPFLEAVDSVFTTMLDLQPDRQPVKVGGGDDDAGAALTSIVGISGRVHGVVALRFPPPTALGVAGRFLGAEMGAINDEVVDAISELANMVAGSAKAKFNQDPPLELGLPTVVEGTGYKLKYPSKSVWLEVPFATEVGSFSMEVTYCEQ
ncbi:MAG: chemotaxis protein CheX [Planctomycetes bacterium]|nr:chemotaxis protein CheX [Planctomycetota bacterium]